MKYWKKFVREAWQERWRIITDRFKAVLEAVHFRPRELANYHFHRYVNYRRVEKRIQFTWGDGKSKLKVVEFGGSNGVIIEFLKNADCEIAPNFPEVDIENLNDYQDKSYDVVILDQILEHVPSPEKAVREVLRVLKPEGVCICVTPFLIKIHGCPDDYFRYTERGLEQLFKNFSQVIVEGWGNRSTLEMFHRYGWLSARNARRILNTALWNEPEWPIEYLTWAKK